MRIFKIIYKIFNMFFSSLYKDIRLQYFSKSYIRNFFKKEQWGSFAVPSYESMFHGEEFIHIFTRYFRSNRSLFSRIVNDKTFHYIIERPLYELIENLLITDFNSPGIVDFFILDLYGILASKSIGYKSLEDFAFHLKKKEKENDRLIEFSSDKDFENNVAHLKLRFKDTPFNIYFQEWNKRYFISNCDGSHHIAALYRQCKEQKRNYYFKAKIIKEWINKNNLATLLNNYFIVMSTENNIELLYKLFSEYNCPFLFIKMAEGSDCEVILLDKKHFFCKYIYENILLHKTSFHVLDEYLYKEYM